jgi:hypothetical protein
LRKFLMLAVCDWQLMLQNAVIISAPDSRFIDRWLESYQTYEEGNWAHHSVVVPWVSSPSFSSSLITLNITANRSRPPGRDTGHEPPSILLANVVRRRDTVHTRKGRLRFQGYGPIRVSNMSATLLFDVDLVDTTPGRAWL